MNRSIKVTLSIAAIAIAIASLSSCTKVPAGNVGVKFDLYGGDKGVTGEVVGPGKYWLGWNEEMYLFPTFTQNTVWTKDSAPGSETDESITFQDKEGTQINADVGISYAIKADKADTVFQKYRKGVDEITDTYVRNMVRDAINSETSTMDVADVYGPGKEKLMSNVTERVRLQVTDIGIIVEKIYWIGAMRLPPTITTAINSKIEATQKAQQTQNEVERTRAEAEKRLIESRSQAEANRVLNASITSDLIRLKELEVQQTAIEKWNGQLPTTVAGTTMPFISVK